MATILRLALCLLVVAPAVAGAQAHQHMAGMHQEALAGAAPTQPGQAAFAALSEVVELLLADSTTDWARADIEGLRRHLIDMDNVVMRAAARIVPVPGGVRVMVEGVGPVKAGIQRMVPAHATVLDGLADYRATGKATPMGAILEVTARDPADERVVARIRGLGFAGLFAVGNHHTAHHLMIARGERPAAHQAH